MVQLTIGPESAMQNSGQPTGRAAVVIFGRSS
jgi:hypothetical protein